MRKCEIFQCGNPQSGHTLKYRPPGYASHEGSFLYLFCQEHYEQYKDEPGYTTVKWDAEQVKFVAQP